MKIVNRKAFRNYHILETLEVGVILSGLEVKSVRAGRVDLSEGFARISKGEVFLKNTYIPPLHPVIDYDPRRDRKILLHKNQINYLSGKISGSAVTLIPLSLYTTHNLIKVELALAASKKKYDKRRAIKEKDERARLAREI